MKDLREDWVFTTLKQVGKIVSGGTPKTTVEEFWGDEISWITPADLSGYNYKYISKGRKSITRKGLERSSARLMPKGTVLFSSRAPIGYTVIASRELSTNQGFKSLIPSEILNSEYLFYYFKSSKQTAEKNASGTTFKELSGKAFSELPISLPPLPEQRAIVAKIEQLFSELDNGIANLKTAQAQLKIYRQAVLKYAFEGKLTRRNHGSGGLQDDTDSRDPQNKISEIPESVKISGSDNLPEGWKWVKLADITEVKDGTHDTPKYHETGIPFITQKNIKESGLSFTDIKFISEEDHKKFYKRSNVTFNDILISMIGANRGMNCLVNDNRMFSIKNVGLIKSNKDNYIEKYLSNFLKSYFARNYIKSLSKGGAQEFIGLTELRKFPIIICPIDEQKQVVQEIDSRLSICDKMEADIKENLSKAEALRQSILKKAFEGRLLSEQELEACRREPDWEPAEKLLERIKKENNKK
jgi:type I restriction enzyme S subunit